MTKKLKELELDEISLVDSPANKGAQAVLYKRDSENKAEKKLTADETSLLKTFVNALTGSSNPDNNDDQLNKGDDAMSGKDKEDATKKGEDLAKTVGDLTGTVAQLTSQLEFYKAQEGMDESELKLARALTDEETKEFLGLSEDERKKKLKEMKKAATDAAAKEEAVKRGISTEVAKEMADLRKQTTEALDIAKSERTKREAMEFEKRAESELPNIPGSAVEKGALLAALDSLPEAQKDAAIKALKAGDAGIKNAAFAEYGKNGGAIVGTSEAEEQLENLAKQHQAKHETSYAVAYDSVLKTAEGAKLYDKVVTN